MRRDSSRHQTAEPFAQPPIARSLRSQTSAWPVWKHLKARSPEWEQIFIRRRNTIRWSRPVSWTPARCTSASEQLTPAADIYSLAKTTYTLLAGESPRRFAQHAIRELPHAIANEYWSRPVLRVLEKATQTQAGKSLSDGAGILGRTGRGSVTANAAAAPTSWRDGNRVLT